MRMFLKIIFRLKINFLESICDRLSQNSLTHAVEELRKLVSQQPKEKDLFDIINIFGHFDELSALLDIKSLFIFTNYFLLKS